MSQWNGALNVEYQNGISHIKMEFWREYDAIVLRQMQNAWLSTSKRVLNCSGQLWI